MCKVLYVIGKVLLGSSRVLKKILYDEVRGTAVCDSGRGPSDSASSLPQLGSTVEAPGRVPRSPGRFQATQGSLIIDRV